jgi:tetratricopeptide (TPR) repeat protein
VNLFDLNQKLQGARQLMLLKDHAEALALYAKLVKQYPQAGLLGEFGRAAAISGDFELADRIWERIRSGEPNNAELLAQLAWEYQNIRLHSKALALHAQAARLDPRNLDRQLSLAEILARTAGVEEARTAVSQCLKLNPRDEQARLLSAHLDRRENKLADAERQLRDLLTSVLKDPQVRYSCHSELAQILDGTGRFEEAMTWLEEGKKFARQVFNVEAERRKVDERHENMVRETRLLPKNILEIWGKTFPPPARAVAPPLVFLTGSARSGTTLLERVLDAHPAVAAGDESRAFQSVETHVNMAGPAISAKELNISRQRYLKNFWMALGRSGEGKVLVDKNPSRTFWLPAFLRVFPELRVLIALRDPRDIMISLYFQDHPNTNCLSFERLARHYQNIMDLWLTVRDWEGLAWRETRYEDIVADLSKEGGRVTQFLGLEWHERQARFHESNRQKPVMSTNYKDVTKPIYTKSVGRWRVYEKHLVPILPMLEPYCKKFGYE